MSNETKAWLKRDPVNAQNSTTIAEAALRGAKANFVTDTLPSNIEEKIDEKDNELRLYCVMRSDLEAPIGKLMAQAGHAFVGCITTLDATSLSEYVNGGSQPKIVLKAKNMKEIMRATNECRAMNIPCYLVTDAGRTVFPEPTVTCLGIGPVAKKNLPKFVQRLQLLEKMSI